jgi:hypothetical protein
MQMPSHLADSQGVFGLNALTAKAMQPMKCPPFDDGLLEKRNTGILRSSTSKRIKGQMSWQGRHLGVCGGCIVQFVVSWRMKSQASSVQSSRL